MRLLERRSGMNLDDFVASTAWSSSYGAQVLADLARNRLVTACQNGVTVHFAPDIDAVD